MTTPRRHGMTLCVAVILLVPATSTTSRPASELAAQAKNSLADAAPQAPAFDLSAPARRFGLSTDWLGAIVHAESRGDPFARSSKGAVGLMQLMPGTYAEMRRRLGLGADPEQPDDNVTAGAAYLRMLTDRYGATGALAAYNAGPGRYERWLNGTATLPGETRAYVARVRSTIGRAGRSGPVRRPATISLHPLASPLFAHVGDALPGPTGKTAPQNERPSATPPLQPSDTSSTAPLATPDPLFAVAHPPGAQP